MKSLTVSWMDLTNSGSSVESTSACASPVAITITSRPIFRSKKQWWKLLQFSIVTNSQFTSLMKMNNLQWEFVFTAWFWDNKGSDDGRVVSLIHCGEEALQSKRLEEEVIVREEDEIKAIVIN